MEKDNIKYLFRCAEKDFRRPYKRVENIIVEGKRSQEKLKRTWDDQIKVDLHELNLFQGLSRDRGSWRRHIHIIDY